MFINASAIVAILTREPEADAFADALEQAAAPITSALAMFEATLGRCRQRFVSVGEESADVVEFLRVVGVRVVEVTEREGHLALDAFARSGKGRVDPAQLNLGDSFAYAVAVANGTTIVFNGDDFMHTDLRPAIGPEERGAPRPSGATGSDS